MKALIGTRNEWTTVDILKAFEKRRLLHRTPSKSDGRRSHLILTARGRAAFAPLDTRSRGEVGTP